MCEETKIVTAAPFANPTHYQLHRRVKLATPCVSAFVAQNHLVVAQPDGMVVRIEHGPKGGWNNPRYYTYHDLYHARSAGRHPRYSWYIVLAVLAKKPVTPKNPAFAEGELPF
jgi:hypothetical protein